MITASIVAFHTKHDELKRLLVGANSVVRGDFPDYSVIVGAPARIVKRYDANQNRWRKSDAQGNFLSKYLLSNIL